MASKKPPRKRKPTQPWVRRDSGRPYQKLVADLVRAFDRGAQVEEGQWVAGPDGRLDMDVSVRGSVDGKPLLVVIECKDFNVRTTGKVGRAFVDALDSKRRDLGADVAMICSNSGFTADALRKATRVRIGMISVLRRGDDRIKAVIERNCYVLWTTFEWERWRFEFTFPSNEERASVSITDPMNVLFDGKPLVLWLQWKASFYAMGHSVLPRTPADPDQVVKGTFAFKEPVAYSCDGRRIRLMSVSVEFAYASEWRVQTVQIDAANGMYDYLRGRIRMSPGNNKYFVVGIDYNGGTVCEPPDPEMPGDLRKGETVIAFSKLRNVARDDREAPDLDALVVAEDMADFAIDRKSWAFI